MNEYNKYNKGNKRKEVVGRNVNFVLLVKTRNVSNHDNSMASVKIMNAPLTFLWQA